VRKIINQSAVTVRLLWNILGVRFFETQGMCVYVWVPFKGHSRSSEVIWPRAYDFLSVIHGNCVGLFCTVEKRKLFKLHLFCFLTPLSKTKAKKHQCKPTIVGSKLTFSTNLFHHSLLALTWTAFPDYTGPDLLCWTFFIFS